MHNIYTEQLFYKHNLSGHKYSDIRSSKIIAIINKLLLSQTSINLHKSLEAHRNFPSVFSQKTSVYICISNVTSFWRNIKNFLKKVPNICTAFIFPYKVLVFSIPCSKELDRLVFKPQLHH